MPSGKLLSGLFNHLSTCRYGYMLYNINDVYIGRSLDLYGEFSEGEVKLFRQLIRTGDIVVDVGANVGAHTLFFAQAVGRAGVVHAFEPQRIVYQTLCANMALNSIANAYCYRAALGEDRGTLVVPPLSYETANNYGGLSLVAHGVGEAVDVFTLDSLSLPQCRFIKIDVEGMELAVLKGARATIDQHKPLLYVENDRPANSDELTRFIDSLGYQIYWHMPALFNPDNFYGNSTNVFGGIVSGNLFCVHPSLNLPIEGFQRTFPGERNPFAP